MRIRGRIVDAISMLALVDVIVTAKHDDRELAAVSTAADGSFEHVGLPAGEYVLHLEKEGHQVDDVKVHTGEQLLELWMKPVAAVTVTEIDGPEPRLAEPLEVARGRCAYFAYGRTTDFKNHQGNPMPEFDKLPDTIRQAWINCAASVIAASQPGGQLAG